MTAQLQLHFTGDPSRKPTRAGRLAARMMAILAANRGWMTRRELAQYGLTPRQCRAARVASHGRILMGQHGYKLLRYATADEVRVCDATILSQIKALQEEHRVLVRRAHRQLHENPSSKMAVKRAMQEIRDKFEGYLDADVELRTSRRT